MGGNRLDEHHNPDVSEGIHYISLKVPPDKIHQGIKGVRVGSMTDACILCGTEAVSLDDWFLKIEEAHGKIAVIECVCPWCVNEYHTEKEKAEKWDNAIKEGIVFGDKEWVLDSIYDLKQENKKLKEIVERVKEIQKDASIHRDILVCYICKQILETKEVDC